MRRVLLICILALSLGHGSAPAASAPSGCGAPCVAAYEAIARALPRDRSEALARAILAVPGFDYARLTRALGIPTAAELHAQWRRRCDALFPGDRQRADECYRLILGPTELGSGRAPA